MDSSNFVVPAVMNSFHHFSIVENSFRYLLITSSCCDLVLSRFLFLRTRSDICIMHIMFLVVSFWTLAPPIGNIGYAQLTPSVILIKYLNPEQHPVRYMHWIWTSSWIRMFSSWCIFVREFAWVFRIFSELFTIMRTNFYPCIYNCWLPSRWSYTIQELGRHQIEAHNSPEVSLSHEIPWDHQRTLILEISVVCKGRW